MKLRPEPTCIGYKAAMKNLNLKKARMIRTRSDRTKTGFAHYIVPGGFVKEATAQKIKDHPQIVAGKDGLFPGHDQTWRMLGVE